MLVGHLLVFASIVFCRAQQKCKRLLPDPTATKPKFEFVVVGVPEMLFRGMSSYCVCLRIRRHVLADSDSAVILNTAGSLKAIAPTVAF